MSKVEKNKRTRNTTKKKKKKMKTWKKVLLVILLILLILIGIFIYRVQRNGGGVSGMLATMVGHDENTKKNLPEFRVLLLGISTDQDGVELTDTIMVASYNPKTQKATLLSIPRDTYTGSNPSRATAYEKINALYSRNRRPDETLEAVNEITGLNIEYYVVIRTEALIELVDVIGGVTFNVPIDMDYDDSSQDLHIHLKAGEQLLDGDKAEQLVRFRHNNDETTYPDEYGNNDTGRMRTQRDFIMATIKQTAKPENIFKIGEILDVAERNVETNIDFDVAKDYIPYVVEFNTDDMVTGVLPGENTNKNAAGTWVFIHDKEETEKLIQELFYDRDLEQEETVTDTDTDTNTSNTTQNTSTTNGTQNSTTTNKVSKADVKVEVINGTGDSSKLQETIDELETSGYNVTRKGTTNTTPKTTIINKKSTDDTILENLKLILGTGERQTSQSTSSKVDVTIVLGKDYL